MAAAECSGRRSGSGSLAYVREARAPSSSEVAGAAWLRQVGMTTSVASARVAVARKVAAASAAAPDDSGSTGMEARPLESADPDGSADGDPGGSWCGSRRTVEPGVPPGPVTLVPPPPPPPPLPLDSIRRIGVECRGRRGPVVQGLPCSRAVRAGGGIGDPSRPLSPGRSPLTPPLPAASAASMS